MVAVTEIVLIVLVVIVLVLLFVTQHIQVKRLYYIEKSLFSLSHQVNNLQQHRINTQWNSLLNHPSTLPRYSREPVSTVAFGIQRLPPPPEPVVYNDKQPEYKVEAILRHKGPQNKQQYLIH